MGLMFRSFVRSRPETMRLHMPETQTRVVRASAGARLQLSAQTRRQGLALAMGLSGLAAAVLIALYSR
jgi:hypothetical protein